MSNFLAEQKAQPGALSLIAAGKYDLVVIQPLVMASAGPAESLWQREIARWKPFAEAAEKAGSHLGIYLYGEPDTPADRKLLLDFVRRHKAILLPGKEAWGYVNRAAREERFDLMLNDGIHTGLHSAYFITCVMYAALTGRSPEGVVPRRIVGQELPLDDATAAWLERTAWRFWSDYRSRNGLTTGFNLLAKPAAGAAAPPDASQP